MKKTKNRLVKILSSLALFSVCSIAAVSAVRVDIPTGTTVIDEHTFDSYNKNDIESVNIPNSVTSISDKAFYG